ncbi:MAG: beta/alpha barrel domain-containing protein, partial [Steroidobacteraceae bacterium]
MPPSAEIERILRLSPVMPVVIIEEAEIAPELARAFVRGGIRVVEITLRTRAALAAIEAIARAVPEIAVGAGTVLNAEDLGAAA